MSESRKDILTDNWVIISDERSKRPIDFKFNTVEKKKDKCVFCEGRENETPPEKFAFRKEGTLENNPGWKVRVVDNKYPALKIDENKKKTERTGIYEKMNGWGVHEVIIETPYHQNDLDSLCTNDISLILKTFRQRYVNISKDKKIKYILIFKNYGVDGGASLEHSHSQLIATSIIPKKIEEELEGSNKYFSSQEKCIFCDYINQEKQNKNRIIIEIDKYIAFSPFASRFPFETWILPKYHNAYYEDISDDEILSVSFLIKEILDRVKTRLNNPPYNLVIHTAPPKHFTIKKWLNLDKEYHWHIEIIPRLTKIAGFELGTGFYINPTSPEDAAKILR